MSHTSYVSSLDGEMGAAMGAKGDIRIELCNLIAAVSTAAIGDGDAVR